ncbi:MAG TPA: C39 family peptidase [Phenylobacterium sp.]|jgi:hypothetical protein
MTRAKIASAAILAAASLAIAGAPTRVAAQVVLNNGGNLFTVRVTSMREMPFQTVIHQRYDYSCGSAALATLLRNHYGRQVDEAMVFKAMYLAGDQVKIRKVGFSLLDMKNYLKSIGLNADGYREDLAELQASPVPAIAVIQVGGYKHFVVIKGVRGGRILVGDPAQGLKAYRASEFAHVWSGIVFRIHPEDEQGSFNLAADWNGLPRAPAAPLYDYSISRLTRDLPPIFQVSTTFVVPLP